MDNVTARLALFIVLAISLLGSACSAVPKPPDDGALPPEPPAPPQCDIRPAIDWISAQHIDYTQNPSDEWRDCSGNFLRLSSRIATLCPSVNLAAPAGIKAYVRNGNNKRPGRAEARTTRGLARWYDDKGVFTAIYYDGVDPLDAPPSLVGMRNRIKTGTVLWFSPDVPLRAGGKTGLYAEQGGAINHMGTVVSVTTDEAGNVTGWDMYHGQNARADNGITRHYWERSGRSRPVPQGGYGSQRIVGIAESIVPSTAQQN